jgi:hypothetical protein
MTTFAQTESRPCEALLALVDQFAGCCDPDFDDGTEELERQFAELRLTLNNH